MNKILLFSINKVEKKRISLPNPTSVRNAIDVIRGKFQIAGFPSIIEVNGYGITLDSGNIFDEIQDGEVADFILDNGSNVPMIPIPTNGFSQNSATMTQRRVDFPANREKAPADTKSPDKISIPTLSAGEFLVFSNLSYNNMVKGDVVTIGLNQDFNYTKIWLFDYFNSMFRIQSFEIRLFFAGGIPYVSGTLAEMISKYKPKSMFIYAIFTRKISEELYNRSISNICDCSKDDMKLLLSPIVESSEIGYTTIASLLGYINRDGLRSDKIIKSLETFCQFSPMLVNLYRLNQKESLKGGEIVQITAPLFIFIYSLLDKANPVECTYEESLKVLTYVSENATLGTISVKDTSEKDNDSTYAYQPEINGEVKVGREYIYAPTISKLKDIYTTVSSAIKPVAPLTLKNISRSCLVITEHGVGLHSQKADGKSASESDSVSVCDPIEGSFKSISADVLAKRLKNSSKDDSSSLVDPQKVEQLVMICFDKSGSMDSTEAFGNVSEKRINVSKQYLSSFANQCYGYKSNSVFGLIKFDSSIDYISELSPYVPDFEKGLDSVDASGGTVLFKTLDFARKKLVACKDKYPKAKLRILVISDGEDNDSSAAKVCQELINDSIIVDSCVVCKADNTGYQRLKSICYLTGGISIKPTNPEEGIKLFTQEAFMSIGSRIIGSPYMKVIDDSILDQYSNHPYSSIAQNIVIEKAKQNDPLMTPRVAIAKTNDAGTNNNMKRIITELRRINRSDDPTIRVYPTEKDITVWKILILGPDGSPYEKSWWYMIAKFGPEYPIEAPEIRFVQPPYHINISDEGKICLNVLSQDYLSNSTVHELLLSIKSLLMVPNPDSPIDSEKASLFKKDKAEFSNRIRQSIRTNSKPTSNKWESEWEIDDNAQPDNFNEILIPLNYKCAMSGEIMTEPVSSAGSKTYYERRTLELYMNSTENPKCFVTGKPLQKPLTLNKALQSEILTFRANNNLN